MKRQDTLGILIAGYGGAVGSTVAAGLDLMVSRHSPRRGMISSLEYACAAIAERCGFVNFTPNRCLVPGLIELAERLRVPVCGRDGKTGQTLLKTALAPVFALRALRVSGWYSLNLQGNRDGEALRNPEACATKVAGLGRAGSKDGVPRSSCGARSQRGEVSESCRKP